MDKTKNVIRISTNEGTGCKLCTPSKIMDNFEDAVNHYIQQHGYKLLHVGAETTHSGNPEQLWYSTVAVLGK